MTDHLPECIGAPLYPSSCICPALRACEQRVADDIWGAIREGSQYKSGFEGGLDAARDAVKNVPCPEGYEAKGCSHWDDALAAIDALRGDA